MSVESIGSSENPSFEKTKNLLNIDTSLVEQSHIKIQNIREMELADNEDNHVTIPDDLKDFFPDKVNENKEILSKIEEFKQALYEKLGLNENLEQNTDIQKFEKGFIDGLLVENIEMLDSLLDKGIDEVVTMIQNLANWDTIVAIVKDVFDSFGDILNTFSDPYEGGLALGGLGLGVVGKGMKGLKIADRLSEYELNLPLFGEQKYKFLEKHKDIIGEDLKLKDIVGEGQNAVVLEYKKNPEYVVKISKERNGVDDIKEEFRNHKTFYDSYIEGKSNGDISGNIIIPKVERLPKEEMFLIEKIDGETLYSESVRTVLEKKGIHLEKGLKDKEIDKIVDTKYKMYQGEINNQAYSDFAKELGLDYYDDVIGMKYYLENDFDNNILNTLRFIKDNTGYMHNDLHSGNIMKSDKGKYIIDFGRVRNFNK